MNKLIAWFVYNPIAANLLMVLIIVGGVLTIPAIDKEFFPEHKINKINIAVSYPGAGPAEVEQQICIRVEEALDNVDGIEEMKSTAREGLGTVRVEIADGYDSGSVLNEVKSRIDAITTFPGEAERPQVSEILWKSRVISVGLAGDIGEANLKELALTVKDELLALPSVQLVQLNAPRNYEVAVEISERDLRRFGLTFSDVANAIRGSSMNLPAGKLRARDGDILLQTRSQAYTGSDFENIVLISNPDGTRVTLGEVATVIDGFEEADMAARFNNLPSLSFDVSISNNPNIMATSEAVTAYVEDLRTRLPQGVIVDSWQDMNDSFEGRVKTLFTNGLGGLGLVFILLLLFLRPLLAMWVAVGIGVAFLGALWLLPGTGTSINIISLFAFILILGIVVDDAIIVGESVYGMQEKYPGKEGAIRGAQVVLKPVFFAVLTTMVVFAGFYSLPADAPEAAHIASVVLLALVFSLVECLLILPSHLAYMKPEQPSTLPGLKQLDALRAKLSKGLEDFTQQRYKPFLIRCMTWRWLTLSVFTIALLVAGAWYGGGWMKRSFFPQVQADFMISTVTFYEGTPYSERFKVMDKVEAQAQRIKDELNTGELDFIGNIQVMTYGDAVYGIVELVNFDSRIYTNNELTAKWREYIGDLPNVKDFEILAELAFRGKAIELELSARDIKQLEAAIADVRTALNEFADVFNIRSSFDNPRPEIVLALKPEAETLKLKLADVARQVRRAYYGEEVQRIPRAREDVKVMVRYPRVEREALDSILNMKIRAPDGREVPFETVASFNYQPGYTKIERIDGRRAAVITAELQPGGQAAEIMKSLFSETLPAIKAARPGINVSLKGEQQESQEFADAVARLIMTTMIVVFAIMAVVFHSYWQPFLIVTAIPFGLVGAIIGHMVVGREFSMFSLMGILACAGVVVNDNLVLVDRINRYRDEGQELWDAIVNGATDRFRAIILTSLTTFVGLLPIMTQRSVQAQFLIPMVAALAFGVLFATFVTLLFTPALYLGGESIKNRLKARTDRWRARVGNAINPGPADQS